MANFFVRKSGSDSNAGTSAGAAWLTLGKALGAAGISSGDNLYVGAGTYREQVTVAMTSATAETKVIADVDGAQTGDAGRVILSAYTTNDTTTPASAALVLAGRDFLTFEGFYIQGGTTYAVDGSSTVSTNITLRRCVLTCSDVQGIGIWLEGSANVAFNLTIQECVFGPVTACVRLNCARHTADYSLATQIRNCLFLQSNYGVLMQSTGAGTGKAGGVDMLNCTCISGNGDAMGIADTNFSTSLPCHVYNCIIWGCYGGITAGTSGQILENFNYINTRAPRTNVTAGANSVTGTGTAPMLDLGSSSLIGMLPRGLLELLPGAPFLGFGNSGVITPPTVDITNRPRPAGGASTSSAIGAYERHDTAAKETGTTDAGGVGLSITGPGDQDLLVPVNAVSTTLSLRARYDSGHAATNKPQALLLANGEIGVTAQTLTMTAAVDTFETLAFAAFTPTAKGFVRLRLVSRSAAGSGKAFFDTAAVPDIDTTDFAHYGRGEPFPVLQSSQVRVNPGLAGGMRG